MGEYRTTTISDIIKEYVNRNTFLPAIQREYVWNTYQIEKLFDSLMCNYPISSFLFWKIREEKKKNWIAYEFIKDYDAEDKHNKEANLDGVNSDINFVLDGQQRMTSLMIGLRGYYRFFYYSWHKQYLYLNLFKSVEFENDNPEELTYEFKFRDNANIDKGCENTQFWYKVGEILNDDEAEDAKERIEPLLEQYSSDLKKNALKLIDKLHSTIHTKKSISFYEETRIDNYDKIVEIFIRTNTGGVKLEYSDILLSTATAKWQHLNAREEINSFTDDINKIGTGYSFGKDFVMKAAMYLTEGLPIQYKVSSFTKENLEKIENNWENIKSSIESTIRLISNFGFINKNVTSTLALLPIALYLKNKHSSKYLTSSNKIDVKDKQIIQKWLIFAFLKNAFSGSSDNTLKMTKDVFSIVNDYSEFPAKELNKKLQIDTSFSEESIEQLLLTKYGTKYSFLILSLLYFDRDWMDKKYNEDHIFPKSEFSDAKLRKRGYSEEKISEYLKYFNTLYNLELLEESENKSKNDLGFEQYIQTRDSVFKERHFIPKMQNYNFDYFLDFIEERKKLLIEKLKSFSF